MSRNSPAMFGNFFSELGPRILVLFSLFSGVLGDCGPPPVLKNAKLYDPVKSSYKPFESVVYICLPGYKELSSKPQISTCSPDKRWNLIEEFCERGCKTPRETRFSVVEEFFRFHPVGIVVHHVCHRSAIHVPGRPERPAITCLSNYTWSSLPVFCKGLPCGDPGKPENGDRILLTDYLLKAKVNFTCNEGYQLIGSSTIQCLPRTYDDNTVVWKPKPPLCLKATCPPPPEIKNGIHTGRKDGTFPINSNVTYTCDLGFSLSGANLLHCITEDNKTGIWRGSVPVCKAQCPTPDLPPHSSLKGGGVLEATYPSGTNLQLQCIAGYEFSARVRTITCLDTGKWSRLPTLCQGKKCPVPHIENGKILSENDLRLGEKVTLGCDYGFRIIGGDSRSCVLKDGKVDWNTELPTCERIPCVRPPEIENGRYDANPSDVYDVSWVVIYRCNADYSLIGNSTITCVVAKNGVDGEWNSPSPECKIVTCHRPNIPNGRVDSVFQATYTYQNKLPIECNAGYSLVSSSIIECGADSQWKPPSPWCDKIPTTSKPAKSPTPAVPSTPPISLRPGIVTPKEDETEATAAPPTTTPKKGAGQAIGIAIGVIIAGLALAALIFAAVKYCSRQGKANTRPASNDDYNVIPKKEMPLEEKSNV